jgi:hypothetical protein
MFQRMFFRSKLSKQQITIVVCVNIVASIAIIRPYFNELAQTHRIKYLQIPEEITIEKK